MANPWFRMYAEFINDPKVQRLSETDQRRYIMLLCIRCSCNVTVTDGNGDVTLQQRDAVLLDTDVAFQMRITDEEWLSTKAILMEKKLIESGNMPVAWEKRQYLSDSSAARVRKHRDLKKNASNAGVTLQKQSVTPPDTDTDTDTDTDKTLKPLAQVASDQRQSPGAGIENQSCKGGDVDGLDGKPKSTGDEQEFELQAQRSAKRKKPAAIVTVQNAFPEVTDRALVADWFALRAMKRAPITMTVIEGFRREIAKINFTEEQGLRKWCERGWVGFEAAWVEKELRGADGKGGSGMPNRHINFEKKDYRRGVSENGRLTVPI